MLSRHLVSLTLSVLFLTGSVLTAQTNKPAKAAKPCVDTIHVIKGCGACESMQDWLKKGGVKLEISRVATSAYDMYPVVIYTDKKQDHGQRMYEQKVVIPKKICVVIHNSGIE